MKTAKIRRIITVLAFMLIVLTSVSRANPDKNTLSEEIFQIPRLDVSFKKPNMWFATGLDYMVENMKKFDIEKENIEKILATSKTSIPIAIFYKYDPSTYSGIIPTINITVLPNSYKNFPTFFRSTENFSKSLANIFNNYKIIKNITESSISGKKVGYFVGEFDLNTVNKTTHRIKTIVYVIPIDNAVIQVSMNEELPAGNLALFSDFINSFVIK